jgi:large subunit ribosomal protein L9
MEVILLERIEKLGQMGDVVNVKPGFARNYLLPQRKALRATKENVKVFEGRRSQLEADNLKRRGEAEAVAKKVDGIKVVLVRQASDTDQLYGSVTPRDIAEAVTAAGFTIERRQVTLDRPIKTVGLHPIRVVLHPEVIVTVTANVARSEEEAEAQARGERIVRTPGEEEEAAIDTAALFEPGSQPAEAEAAPESKGESDAA